MSAKRKDSKGRNLRTGESQRNDGRYMYRYTDPHGKRMSVYSWRLVETDRTPTGKKNEPALRDMEKDIQKQLESKVDVYHASKTTINDLYDKFVQVRIDLKLSTLQIYDVIYNAHIRDVFGDERVDKFSKDSLRRFYIEALEEERLSLATLNKIQIMLTQLFDIAIEDGIIGNNPVRGILNKITRAKHDVAVKKHALTLEEQTEFIKYVYSTSTSKKWGNLFTTLLGTGMRIGEACALQISDCDFERNIINIRHTLRYSQGYKSKNDYHMLSPKTQSGYRQIPMLPEVKEALLDEIEKRKSSSLPKYEVDGYDDFVFLKRSGKPCEPISLSPILHRIILRHNEKEISLAEEEKRDPIILPNFTLHSLRHTFCTRLCENETNLKVIQEIMGHSKISTTMDIYNEATLQKKEESFEKLQGKFKIR